MPETSFDDLPPELRNYIYHLADCLVIDQCGLCGRRMEGYSVEFSTMAFAEVASRDFVISELSPKACCGPRGTLPLVMCHNMLPRREACIGLNRRSDLAKQGQQQQFQPKWIEPIEQRERGEPSGPKPTRTKPTQPPHEFEGHENISKAQSLRSETACRWKCTAVNHPQHQGLFAEQPAMAFVSKQTRAGVLPVFYGTNRFVFVLLQIVPDTDSLLRWLSTIGPRNASLLCDLAIVVRKKAYLSTVNQRVLPALRGQGVRVNAGVVRVVRLKYPHCYCESCILTAAEHFVMMDHVKEQVDAAFAEERGGWIL